MKPRLDNSRQATLFRLLAERWATRKTMWAAGPVSGLYSAALTRPKGTNSGWVCAAADCAVNAAATAKAQPESNLPSLMTFHSRCCNNRADHRAKRCCHEQGRI